MGGSVKSLIEERVVDFGGVPSGATQELILADAVEFIEWAEVSLMFRIHGHSLASGAGTIAIGAYGQSISADDPSLTFLDTATSFYFVTLASGTPTMAYFVVGNVNHPVVRLVARGTRSAIGALNATISIEASVKDA